MTNPHHPPSPRAKWPKTGLKMAAIAFLSVLAGCVYMLAVCWLMPSPQ